jgi:hypothetical protein
MHARHHGFLLAVLSALCGAAHADNCEPIRAQIETKIRDAGVAVFTVTVVPNAVATMGEVVGSCDNGQKKIVYARGAGAAPAPATTPPAAASGAPKSVPPASSRPRRPTPASDILTECKDGSVSRGGSCPAAGR